MGKEMIVDTEYTGVCVRRLGGRTIQDREIGRAHV